MICGTFHKGSGLGNQLHRYVMTRVVALDKRTDWGMFNGDDFKGRDFMKIEIQKPNMDVDVHCYEEKRTNNSAGVDIRDYDWEGINLIKDNTIIDGEFQGEKYFEHHIPRICEWLKVDFLKLPENLCIINFRGGEYIYVKDLFLPKSYWDEAIKMMEEKYPDIFFEVHTDDPITAKQFFPDFPIIHSIELNWRSIRYAKHLIISNSSFAILPALLNEEVKEIIAPMYWAGRNVGYWKMNQNQYKKFTYI